LQNISAATSGTLAGIINETKVSITPNPAKDIAQVFFTAKQNATYTLQLKSVTGSTLQTQLIHAVKGSNSVGLNVSRYANGLYFVTIINNNGDHIMLKLLKE